MTHTKHQAEKWERSLASPASEPHNPLSKVTEERPMGRWTSAEHQLCVESFRAIYGRIPRFAQVWAYMENDSIDNFDSMVPGPYPLQDTYPASIPLTIF